MRPRFTPQAARELDEVLTGLAEQSPQGARRVRSRIRQTIELLARFPHGGQRTQHERLRRIVVVPYPYLIFYEVKGDEVVVIGVRHASRAPGTMPG